jgi:hypothetical protein
MFLTITYTILGLVIILLVAAAILWRLTKAKSRWGLGSVAGLKCPRCGTPLPTIRKPSSMQEML